MKYKSIKVGEMRTDPTYQRVPNERRVKKIASSWDDLLANPIVLSERSDGSVYVLDGNHTRLALMSIMGPDGKLPCRIYDGLTVKEEAAIFSKLNTSQSKPNFNEILKAKLASGDEFTVRYFDALDVSGLSYSFRTRSGAFRAHSSLMKVYKSAPYDLFVRSVKAAVIASADREDFFKVGILPGFCSVITKHPECNDDRLIRVTQHTTIPKINDIAETYSRGKKTGGGESVTTNFRNAFIDLYNTNLRKNKLQK